MLGTARDSMTESEIACGKCRKSQTSVVYPLLYFHLRTCVFGDVWNWICSPSKPRSNYQGHRKENLYWQKSPPIHALSVGYAAHTVPRRSMRSKIPHCDFACISGRFWQMDSDRRSTFQRETVRLERIVYLKKIKGTTEDE